MPPSPPRLQKPIELAPLPTTKPLAPREGHEARAVRAALALIVAVVHAEGFTANLYPDADDPDGRHRYLRRQLLPLAVHSPTIRQIVAILDPTRETRTWYSESAMRAQLRLLTQRIRQLARALGQQAAARHAGRRSSRRGQP